MRKRERRTEKSERKIKKINQEKIGGDLIFNLSSVCYLEKDQKVRFLNKTLDLVEFRS